jgi:glycine/D-amino acid oxidase-like deaminating enzyme
VGQVAGVRPASRDRRPIIGEHPIHKKLWCYNGLGAKGLLLAPQISKWLLGKMFNNQNFPEDIDIKRYYQN